MHITDFTFTPTEVTVIVHDGERQAIVVIEKNSGKIISAEAVGDTDKASCFSFADEAAAWLSAYAKPKHLGRSAAA